MCTEVVALSRVIGEGLFFGGLSTGLNESGSLCFEDGMDRCLHFFRTFRGLRTGFPGGFFSEF